MQNRYELENFKIFFSRNILKCVLIENVSISIVEFDVLEYERLKIKVSKKAWKRYPFTV